VRADFALDAQLAADYHALLGGKWDRMMSQTHLGYTTWSDPPVNVMPAVSEVQAPRDGDLGLAVEGSELAARGRAPLVLPALDTIEKRARYIEVFNRGESPMQVSLDPKAPWLRFAVAGRPEAAFRVGPHEDVRVDVGADWDAIPPGTHDASFFVDADTGSLLEVKVPVIRRDMPSGTGFIETSGVVSIEAEHYTRAVAPAGRSWLTIPDFGRTLSGVTTLPVESPATTIADGERLEYAIHFFDAGNVQVHAILAPTQKFRPGPGLRYAISFDDEPAQVVDVHADESREHWSRTVLDGVTELTTTHKLAKPGAHTLKYWALDPGLVLEKLVVDAGGLRPSYLGPPESPRIP